MAGSTTSLHCGRVRGRIYGFTSERVSMASLSDQAVGVFLMLLASVVFVYYSVWVMVLPFVATDHALHQFFMPRYYALALPIAAGALLLCAIGVFVTIVMMKESMKRKEKLAKGAQKKAQ